MSADGLARVLVAVLATVAGAIGLSAFALLALELRADPGVPAAPAAVATRSPAEVAPATTPAPPIEATRAPTESPAAATVDTRDASVDESASTAAAPPPEPTATSPPDEVQYVVVSGDALELVAGRFGVPAARIVERNGLQPPYLLTVGQVLIIPSDQ